MLFSTQYHDVGYLGQRLINAQCQYSGTKHLCMPKISSPPEIRSCVCRHGWLKMFLFTCLARNQTVFSSTFDCRYGHGSLSFSRHYLAVASRHFTSIRFIYKRASKCAQMTIVSDESFHDARLVWDMLFEPFHEQRKVFCFQRGKGTSPIKEVSVFKLAKQDQEHRSHCVALFLLESGQCRSLSSNVPQCGLVTSESCSLVLHRTSCSAARTASCMHRSSKMMLGPRDRLKHMVKVE